MMKGQSAVDQKRNQGYGPAKLHFILANELKLFVGYEAVFLLLLAELPAGQNAPS